MEGRGVRSSCPVHVPVPPTINTVSHTFVYTGSSLIISVAGKFRRKFPENFAWLPENSSISDTYKCNEHPATCIFISPDLYLHVACMHHILQCLHAN